MVFALIYINNRQKRSQKTSLLLSISRWDFCTGFIHLLSFSRYKQKSQFIAAKIEKALETFSVKVSVGIGFAWLGFGSRRDCGVASVRSSYKVPPCLTEPVPATSRTDLPLAKAEPIREGSYISNNVFNKEKILLHSCNCTENRGGRIREKNNSSDTKFSGQGGGRGAPGARNEIPLQLMAKILM